MLKKSLCVFLFLSLVLTVGGSVSAQEKMGIEFVKQLAKDIITEDYKNILILSAKEALEEEAVLELKKDLDYADVPFSFQEVELGTTPEIRRAISNILTSEVKGIIPVGDANALEIIVQEMRNLGVKQPVYMYTKTEGGERVLKEKYIMPTYTKVLQLERPLEEDAIYMKNGDKLTGEVISPSIGIRTSYGEISFDTRLIAGITFEAEAYMERIHTVNKSYFSGFITNPTITFRLSVGGEMQVLKEKIAKILFHVREKELRGIPKNDTFYLANGDALSGKLTDEVLNIRATYGDIPPLDVNIIRDITFVAKEQVLTEVILENGDEINGELQNDYINIDLDAGPPIAVYQDKIKEIHMREGYEEPIIIISIPIPTPIPSTGDMVLIPAGEFIMGSNDGNDDEKPIHKVYLDAYYIDKYEVTNAQFSEFLNEKGNQEEGGVSWLDISSKYCLIEYKNGKYQPKPGYENHPVFVVSWYGAMAYAEWAGKRLPTEAEWEKAARGGLVGKKYPWGDEYPHEDGNYLEYRGNLTTQMSDLVEGRGTLPVGSFPPNNYGLYDMAGNVFEWVSDWYDEDYYSSSPYQNPQGPSKASRRVIRGGSWFMEFPSIRCANRHYWPPEYALVDLGFRCVKSP